MLRFFASRLQIVSDPAKGGAAGKRAVRLRRVGGADGAIDEISSALQAMTGEDGHNAAGDSTAYGKGMGKGSGLGSSGAPVNGPPLSDALFRLRQLVALGDSDTLVLSGGELLELMGREDLPQHAVRSLCTCLARPALRDSPGAARIYAAVRSSAFFASPRMLRSYIMTLSTDELYRLVADEDGKGKGKGNKRSKSVTKGNKGASRFSAFVPSDAEARSRALQRAFLPVARLLSELLQVHFSCGNPGAPHSCWLNRATHVQICSACLFRQADPQSVPFVGGCWWLSVLMQRDRAAHVEMRPLIDTLAYAVDKVSLAACCWTQRFRCSAAVLVLPRSLHIEAALLLLLRSLSLVVSCVTARVRGES